MREFLILTAYLLLALCLAAGLLPVLDAALASVADVRADRLFYRAAMVIALLGLWPLLRWRRLQDRASLGYALSRAQFLARLWWGWLAGLVVLAGLLGLEWLAGIRLPRPEIDPSKLLTVVVGGIIGGLLVALIEETFFRGVMHSALRRRLSFATTASLSAALYASLHFVRPPRLAADFEVTWNTGWKLLAAMPRAYAEPLALLDSWIALFAVGVFLSLVRERSGNIALAIGLHAGWIAVIKTGKYVTMLQTEAPLAFLVDRYDGIIGWLAAGWIALFAWLYRQGAGTARGS
ncbi:MAG: CPBP family intramembrane metalloprotease [Planctomycetes bacterium]|nr:CPBP family intramembrane metalloprotease [Planctomycetota bacterium]